MKLIAWSALFVAGVALGGFAGLAPGNGMPWSGWWLLVASASFLVAALTLSRRRTATGIAVIALLLGLARGGDIQPPAWTGLPPDGSTVTIESRLIEDPAPASNAVRLRLQASSVTHGGATSEVDFLFDAYVARISAPPEANRAVDGFRYGDRYWLAGTWRVYDEDRNAAGSLASGTAVLIGEGEGRQVRQWLAVVRQQLAGSLESSLDSRTAGLATAMLTGDRRHLSQDTLQAFRDSGTAHLLAISGLHVAIFGGLALTWSVLLIGRHRQIYLLLPLLAVWGYALLAGLSPSVTRAAIMFTVYLAARWLGRQRSVLPALGLAGAVMVALEPAIVASVSFQLSFAAVLGIAGLAPPSTRVWQRYVAGRFEGRQLAHRSAMWVGTGLAASAGATLMTSPIVASTFGAVPLLGAVATLLMLPVLPLLIISGFASAALGLLYTPLGQVAGWPAWLAANYLSAVGSVFSTVPHGVAQSPPWQGWLAAGYYFVTAALLWQRHLIREARSLASTLRRSRPSQMPPKWAAAGVGMIVLIAWTGALSAGRPGLLEVTFFETDVGDAIFIQSPSGTQALIDGGRSTLGAVRSLEGRMPFSDRTIDLVVLTHGDLDHVGGLQAVLDRYTVTHVADSPQPSETRAYSDWLTAVESHPGRLTLVGGEFISLGGGVTLEVVSAGPTYDGASDNDSSVVLLLKYGEVTMLLPGDLESRGEAALLSGGTLIDADLLLAGHHGSRTSSSQAFVDAVSPVAVVVSAGVNNPYGHPHGDVIERLQSHVCDACLYRTDHHGDVTVATDGTRLWVETAR